MLCSVKLKRYECPEHSILRAKIVIVNCDVQKKYWQVNRKLWFKFYLIGILV